MKRFCAVLAAGIVLSSASPPADAAEQRFQLAIAERKLASPTPGTPPPKVIRVRRGDTVLLEWATDEVAELHLHGYDRALTVRPGTPATLRFEARATGRFAISVHRFGEGGHGHDEVTLLYLEVLPR